MRYPCLSYLELPRFSSLLESALQGGRVDRVFVPECAEHPQGFFKNEIVLETRNGQLLISLRPQACGLAYLAPKTLKPSKVATRYGFDLSLSKTLEGTRFDHLQAIEGERILQITFSTSPSLSLFLNLMPALPEGNLVEQDSDSELTLIASSRLRTAFTTPLIRQVDPSIAAKVPHRSELIASLQHYSSEWMNARNQEALQLRKQKILNRLQLQLDAINRKLVSLQEQADQSRHEPDWNHYGTLLQTHLYTKPKLIDGHYELLDYETNALVKIPGDPKLSLQQQLEKYFHQAKRNKKRIEEGSTRMAELVQRQSVIEHEMERIKRLESPSLSQLGSLEPEDRSAPKKLAGFAGKMYRSQEGMTILSGRSKDENLELTFKIARGNDLWLHVKGRPGSHTVILIPPGKTASLETLLDAANLCLLHSGGKDWGKTEVDYTQRKYVKKIKGQTEVTYSGNKTLVVAVEADRIKRLYQEE